MINYMRSLFDRHHVLRYLIMGGFNTLVCLAVYYGLLKLRVNYLVDTSITNIVGVLEGFMLNALFVFRQKIVFSGLFKYSAVYGIGFINNLALMYIFVDLLHVSAWIAPLPTIIICTVINYWMVRHFVFSHSN